MYKRLKRRINGNNNENSNYIIWPIFPIVSRNYYLQLHQPEKNHLLKASTNGEYSDQEFNDNTKYYISIRFQRSLRDTSEIGTVHIYNGCHELSIYVCRLYLSTFLSKSSFTYLMLYLRNVKHRKGILHGNFSGNSLQI